MYAKYSKFVYHIVCSTYWLNWYLCAFHSVLLFSTRPTNIFHWKPQRISKKYALTQTFHSSETFSINFAFLRSEIVFNKKFQLSGCMLKIPVRKCLMNFNFNAISVIGFTFPSCFTLKPFSQWIFIYLYIVERILFLQETTQTWLWFWQRFIYWIYSHSV